MGGNRFSRRDFLLASGGVAAGMVAAARMGGGAGADPARPAALRGPGSLWRPTDPIGTTTEDLPFDHVVIVMMENHSFDNYFGMLPLFGQPAADGFAFDTGGVPTNANPSPNGAVQVFHNDGPCQPSGVTQAWTPTHQQIDGGRMDGFAQTNIGSMGYWDGNDLPFYYSLAEHFTLANRWFCSAPCQTYPNRRFLMAGTAYGLISTDTSSLADPPPANGTIFDSLNDAGISWKNYFTDLPSTAIIPSIIEHNPGGLAPLAQFHLDCAAGTLPAVSLLDCDFNLLDTVFGEADVSAIPLPSELQALIQFIRAQGASEENPTNIDFGEAFVSQVVQSVLCSPAWPRTLLIWTYDEHGGYYDHVPPPAAIAPDNIAPVLGPDDTPGGYDLYGPRVPTVVVSPYSIPGGVTNVVHDHTSIMATIEKKWNLPALTYRDANAATLEDFLDLTSPPRLLTPPTLAVPADLVTGDLNCDTTTPQPAPAGQGYPPQDESVTEIVTQVLGQVGF